ncbi:hypothetical protein PanWU01x14_125840 [Parasponia andersonii]|uniref:Uncharacterized protein n=1 Tax=Parasponia andersonii TaxID=3476 RepID=A0A2P5CT94_PARAD|nr:hypothetical protein PanWU01x14_125840 [Parasponia andersonii]
MANEVFGQKDLFSFHSKNFSLIVGGGSSFVKSDSKIDVIGESNEVLMAANLSGGLAATLLSSSHARGTRVSELGQRKGNRVGPSYAQILSSSTRVDRDVNTSTTLPSLEIVMPHASIIALELSKPSIKGNYVCVQVNKQVLKKKMHGIVLISLIGYNFLSKGETP